MRCGSFHVKTLFSKSSALLPRVTAADHLRFCCFALISIAFKKLYLAFVALGGFKCLKGAQIPAFTGCRIAPARVNPITARFKFTYHKMFIVTFLFVPLFARRRLSPRDLWCELLSARPQTVPMRFCVVPHCESGVKWQASNPRHGLRGAKPRVWLVNGGAKQYCYGDAVPFRSPVLPGGGYAMKTFRASAAAVLSRHAAPLTGQSQLPVSPNALHASPHGHGEIPPGQILPLGLKEIFLCERPCAPAPWFLFRAYNNCFSPNHANQIKAESFQQICRMQFIKNLHRAKHLQRKIKRRAIFLHAVSLQ